MYLLSTQHVLVLLILAYVCIVKAYHIHRISVSRNLPIKTNYIAVKQSNTENNNEPIQPIASNIPDTTESASGEVQEDPYANETPAEKYKREKLAEIAERKAAEVFVVRDTGKYECQSCGYVYNTGAGMPSKGIKPGTPFDQIEKFRCPQCGASKKYFVAETEEISGFKENLKYGLGGNSLTAGQKSNLIFGGLFLGFIIFLSGYLLD